MRCAHEWTSQQVVRGVWRLTCRKCGRKLVQSYNKQDYLRKQGNRDRRMERAARIRNALA